MLNAEAVREAKIRYVVGHRQMRELNELEEICETVNDVK